MLTDTFASRIRQAREEAGLTREQLAVQLGCGYATICRYETGKRKRVTLQDLELIASATGKPAAWFLAVAA